MCVIIIIEKKIELGCNVKNDWCEVKKTLDIGTYLFIEKWLRGNISYIAKRYSEANNKCTKNNHSTKPSIYTEYLDTNTFHGWTMSGYLQFDEFKWLRNVDNFDVNSMSEKSPIGCILEV